MARPRQEGLTPREMQIMQVVWEHGEVSVEIIQGELPDRLVDSTIRTLLQIMKKKGYVTFRKQGRVKLYRPIIAQQDVRKSAVRQLVDRVFGGSTEMLLAQLVEDEQVDLEKLARLKERLERRKEKSS